MSRWNRRHRIVRRRFSREFKLEAVRPIRERGVGVARAARDLDVQENQLASGSRSSPPIRRRRFPDGRIGLRWCPRNRQQARACRLLGRHPATQRRVPRGRNDEEADRRCRRTRSSMRASRLPEDRLINSHRVAPFGSLVTTEYSRAGSLEPHHLSMFVPRACRLPSATHVAAGRGVRDGI